MDTKEILKFCMENGLLLDKDVLGLFQEVGDVESIKLIINKMKGHTHQKIITKTLFEENKEKVNKFFLELPKENQKSLEVLKIKLGLSIEISREKEIVKETKDGESGLNNFEVGKVKVLTDPSPVGKKFEVLDFVHYFRARFNELKKILEQHSKLDNLVSIGKFSGNRQGVSIIGLVSSKRVTKNNNILLGVEDFTGKINVLINNNKPELHKIAEDITLDSVLGFRGSGSKEIFFVNEVVFPEAFLHERKRSPVEEYALFTGDLHFGSKRFLKEGFNKFLDYLGGNVPNTPEVEKIKYLFLGGDVVTGVGNYPNQEKDLEIKDIEEQFLALSELLKKIKRGINIIISPGNHDGVRLMEPQPFFDEKYAWPLYDLKNVILTTNPATVNIGAKNNFSGFDVLNYHGFSFPYYANNIPSLAKTNSMNSPEKIMEYLLKNRHLAPTHGSVQYYPSKKDFHLIKGVPDVFFACHTHKSAVSYFNNVLVISSSCWEALTPYQEKFGNTPDHCKVPMLNLKTRAVKILDFEGDEEEK